jgi:hypothetical protein
VAGQHEPHGVWGHAPRRDPTKLATTVSARSELNALYTLEMFDVLELDLDDEDQLLRHLEAPLPVRRDVCGYPMGFMSQLVSFILLSKLITIHVTLIHFYKLWADSLTHKVGNLHPYWCELVRERSPAAQRLSARSLDSEPRKA